MTCPFCQGHVPLPPRETEAVCQGCCRRFVETQDLGFFDYSLEIYAPKEDRREPVS